MILSTLSFTATPTFAPDTFCKFGLPFFGVQKLWPVFSRIITPNAELANLAPRIRQACPVALRILITVNDEVVMKDVERRKTSQSKQDVWSTI